MWGSRSRFSHRSSFRQNLSEGPRAPLTPPCSEKKKKIHPKVCATRVQNILFVQLKWPLRRFFPFDLSWSRLCCVPLRHGPVGSAPWSSVWQTSRRDWRKQGGSVQENPAIVIVGGLDCGLSVVSASPAELSPSGSRRAGNSRETRHELELRGRRGLAF